MAPSDLFFKKISLTETWYETNDGELLGIAKAFITWRYYLKSCKHKIFVLIDYNNLQRFMDTTTWALGKFYELKNCQGTTSELIINKAKLIKLLMPYFDISSKVLKKKRPFKLRIQRFCTNCNHYWLKY